MLARDDPVREHCITIEHFASSDPYARTAAAVLRLIFADNYARNFSVELWDGSRSSRNSASEFTLKINSPAAFRLASRFNLPAYFAKAFALLRPGGLFLNHGIAEQDAGVPAASRKVSWSVSFP